MNPVFELVAKLSLDKSEFDKGIDKSEKQGSSLASKLGKGLTSAGKLAAKGLAAGFTATVAGITALTKSAVEAYSNYEQLTGGVETLFGTSAKSLEGYRQQIGLGANATKKQLAQSFKDYKMYTEAQETVMNDAREAYKTAGVDMNTYMETATSFSAALVSSLKGDTKKAADITKTAVVDMADNANKMGTDLESIQNAYKGFSKGNYTMLDNLKLGYGGTRSEMKRLLSDASKLTGKKYNMKNFSDIIEAIHAIQENMGIAGTTSEEAATTIQGSIGMLKASWTNLQIAMADPKGDIGTAISNVVGSAKTAFSNLIPIIKQTLLGIGTAVKELAPIIGKELPGIIADLAPQIWEIFTGFVSGVWEGMRSLFDEIEWPTWEDVKTGAKQAWNTVVNGVKNLAGLVFGTNEDGSVKWPTWDDVKAAALKAWELIKAGAANLAGLVFGKNQDGSVKWPTWADIKAKALEVWNTIKQGAANLGGLIFGSNADGSVKWPTWADVKQAAITAWENIKSNLESIVTWFLGTPEMPTAYQMGQKVREWWGKILSVVKGAIRWVLSVPSMEDEDGSIMVQVITAWWNNLVKPFLKGILDYTLGVFGLPDSETMVANIKTWWAGVKKSIKSAFDYTIGLFKLPDFNSMVTAIGIWWSGVKTKLKESISYTLGLFELPDFQDMVNAINTWWNNVKSAIGDLVLKIVPKIFTGGNSEEPGWESNDNIDLSGVTLGGNAKGLWDVPKDDYVTKLHRGEMVLNASRARDYREGNSNSGVNYKKLAAAVSGAVTSGMSGVSVNSYLSGRDVTAETNRENIRTWRSRRYAT